MCNLQIQILSVPHREKLIAEIQNDHFVIAEINHDNEEPEIEVFSYENHPIAIPLSEFVRVIEEAKRKLLGEI